MGATNKVLDLTLGVERLLGFDAVLSNFYNQHWILFNQRVSINSWKLLGAQVRSTDDDHENQALRLRLTLGLHTIHTYHKLSQDLLSISKLEFNF